MIKKGSRLILYLVWILIVAGCGKKEIINRIDDKIGDKELRENLLKISTKPCNYFNAKVSVDFKNSKVNQSFRTSLKMTVDSVFSGTVSYAGFIVANFLANEDSLKANYKQNKCYFTEDFSYISSIFGVELEYSFFEDMLLGQPIGVDSTIKYKQIKDKNKEYYILSSHKKRKYTRIEKDKIDLENEKNDDIFIKYFFSSDSLALKKMIFEIPIDSVSIAINYVESSIEDNILIPEYTTVNIKYPKDTITIGLSYSKHAINNPKKHIFSVPNHYENCNK
ncbi:MAG: DUF4292 domain-containing protein [Crocinitomicaceae bacterium]